MQSHRRGAINVAIFVAVAALAFLYIVVLEGPYPELVWPPIFLLLIAVLYINIVLTSLRKKRLVESLAAFLRARLAEDEARVRFGAPAQWQSWMLEEIESRRSVVVMLDRLAHKRFDLVLQDLGGSDAPQLSGIVLIIMARRYSRHPEYRAEWREMEPKIRTRQHGADRLQVGSSNTP